jgi:hypothetical protein
MTCVPAPAGKMPGMDHHQIARLMAAGRLVLGILLLLFPRRIGRLWIGPVADHREASVMTRGMGARDAALAAGTLRALANGESARPWIVGGIAADGTDALATLAVAGRIGRLRAVLVAATAFSSAVTGASIIDKVDAA